MSFSTLLEWKLEKEITYDNCLPLFMVQLARKQNLWQNALRRISLVCHKGNAIYNRYLFTAYHLLINAIYVPKPYRTHIIRHWDFTCID